MSEPTSTSALDAATDPDVQPKRASWWEDYIDIFYTPSTVFSRRMTSGFGLPLLILTVVIGVLALANSGAISSIVDAEFARSVAATIKKNPQITQEQMEKGRPFATAMTKVGGFIFAPIGVLLVGLFLWIVGKFVGAKQTLGAAMMVTAYSYFPRALEQVLVSIQALVLDTSALRGRFQLSWGAGRFLDPDTTSPALLALLGRVDVFTIWVTVLLAIGLSVTGKIPRGKAAIAGVIMWFLGAAATVLPALNQ
jgi:Yip1 domain